MRVLVTRPQPVADATAARLRQAGHAVSVAPLMTCHTLNPDPAAIRCADGYILTSSRAAHALSVASLEKPVFCVGSATANAARAHGAKAIVDAHGDWQDLARSIVASGRTWSGMQLLHLCGERYRDRLDDALCQFDIRLKRLPVYRMIDVESIPQPAQSFLDQQKLGAVLFYSPATSACWTRLLRDRPAISQLSALCLSAACAEPLIARDWAAIHISASPNEIALLALLDALRRRC